MNFKSMVFMGCLLLMLCPGSIQAEEEPIIYTVKEGDTLWDISQRFIRDPFYWPNLWSHNPDIGNPHLIFPGQKLRIYDGRIEIIPIAEAPGSKTTDAVFLAPDEIRLQSTFGGSRSFIGSKDLDSLGTLVDTVDNRILIAEQDTVFMEMKDLSTVRPGDTYELVSIGDQIVHPVSRKPIGYKVTQLGTVDISEVTPTVAVGLITDAMYEIQRGAKLRPYVLYPSRIERKFSEKMLEGYIVSADDGKLALGQWDVIHIDIGTADGLQVGHELDLNRQRKATKEALKRGEELQLPDIDLGDAVVLEVGEEFSEALIIRTTNLPLYRGDHVATKGTP